MNANRMQFVAAFVLAAAAAGCASPPRPPLTSADAMQQTKVQGSSFDAQATLLGPAQTFSTQRGLLSDRVTWRVRVFIDKKTGEASAQLYASVWHQDRSARNYRSVSTAAGEQIRAVRIGYEPQCSAGGGYVSCTHTETFGATIPSAAWVSAVRDGLALRLNSQAGLNNEFSIPAAYVQGVTEATQARGGQFSTK